MKQNCLGKGCAFRSFWQSAVLCGLALMWAGAAQAAPPPGGIAQVTVPAGGFAIDGDLLSGSEAGDWLAGANGAGVLDSAGLPLNPATTFHFIDAFNSTSDQTFGGGLKWTDNPGLWTWTSAKASSKTDINNVLLHVTSDSEGHTWLVIAADRASNSGDSYIDFEFLQNPLYLTNNNKFYSAGKDGGRTSNDLLLSLAFTGGGNIADFFAWRWLPNGSGGFNYVDATASLPAGRVFVAASPDNVAVPFGAFGDTTYAANAFAEAAIDLTALLGNFDPCLSIGVKTIMVKTKTSQASTASINDFIDPIQYLLRLGPGAYAGPDQTRCTEGPSTSFPLQGEAKRGMRPIASTTWSVVDGTATIDAPESPSTTAHVSSIKATLRFTVVQADGCSEADDIVLTVASRPVFSVSGATTVCPQSTTVFDAPAGLTGYSWTIEGSGQLSGPKDSRQVTVEAGAGCGESFTLTVAASDQLCSGTATLKVLVNDANPPVLKVPANVTLECPADTGTNTTGVPIATDDCGTPAVTFTDFVTEGPGATKTIKRTWTAVDVCGNAASADQLIVVNDTTKPTVTCPKDLVLECADSQQAGKIAAWLAAATGTDTCGSVRLVNDYDPARFSDGPGNTGEQVVTFTAIDESGNRASGAATIIIQDTMPPTITCPGELVLECADPAREAKIATWLASATASDSCGSVKISSSYVATGFSDGPGNTGEQLVTFTATDDSGNKASCNSRIVIKDSTPPTITCPSELVLECADPAQVTKIAAWLASVTGSDTCGSLSYANDYDPARFTDGPGNTGEQLVTFTATDDSGNKASCSARIVIKDSTPPVVVCPKDLEVECADAQQAARIAVWLATVTGSDTCGSVSFANNYDPAKFSRACGNAGEQLVTFTATDESGNKATGTAKIIIKDSTPPAITCPSDLVLESGDPTQSTRIAAWLAGVKGIDTCGTVLTRNDYAVDKFSDGCGNTGEQTVTFTATDQCGNSATCAARIVIRDTTPPKIVCPSVAVQCADDVPAPYADLAAFRAAGGSASDNGSSVLAFSQVSDSGLVGSCPGKVTRVYRVTDECGNSAQGTQTIIVDDTTPPVVTCPPGVILETGASLEPATTGTAKATDNCSGTLTTAYSDTVVPSQYLIKFYAADPVTNSAPYLPTYVKLAPRDLPCPESARLTGRAMDPLRHAVAFDPDGKLDALTSMGGEPLVLGQIVPFEAVIEVSGSRGPEHGTIEFTASWNTYTTSNEKFGYDKNWMVYCAFVDPLDPGSFDPHRNARVESYSSKIVDEGMVTEKIQGTFRVSGLDSGDRVVVEMWVVLMSSMPAKVGGTIAADLVSAHKVLDPPESIFTGTQTISIGNLSKIGPLPPLGQPTPPQPPLPALPPDGPLPGTIVSVIDRTWKATDNCGNQGSCVQQITVVDNTPPVMSVPPDLVLEYPADTSPAATGTAVATDPGSSVSINFTDYVESICGPARIISREWIANDEFGHSKSAFQSITVVDTTAPDLTVPADVVLKYPADTSPAGTGSATAVDAGGSVTISYNDACTRNGSTRTISRTWAAVDECGNAATGEQSITVLDAPLDVVISAAPRQQNPGRGNNLYLSVTAESSEPLSYQWYLNGQSIAGATDSSYHLTSLKFSDAGIYSVVISTPEGPVIESRAVVNVLPKLSANVQRQWLTVAWEGDFILQSSTSISGLYADLSVTNGSYAVTTDEPRRFFRLRPKAFSISVAPGSSSGTAVSVTGSPGLNFVLQGSSNLVDWVSLATATAPFTYMDTSAQGTGSRRYRVVPLPDTTSSPTSGGSTVLKPQPMQISSD